MILYKMFKYFVDDFFEGLSNLSPTQLSQLIHAKVYGLGFTPTMPSKLFRLKE
jgi:hypothetical protein